MRANILIVVILTLCLGCRRGSDGGVERSETMVSLDLFVGSGSLTRSTSLSDDSFSDLALYIFNEGGELELYHKEDALSQQIMVEIALHLSEGEKEIFIFANYLDKSLYDVSGEPCTLNEDSSLEQLNSLTTCIESDFDPTSLLMVGRAEVEITPQSESISIELRRLSARLDIHIFKGEGFDGEDITVESVSFDNQILNSEVVFDYDEATAQMVQPIVLGEQSVVCGYSLDSYSDEVELSEREADVTLYSYQNLTASTMAQVAILLGGDAGELRYTASIADDNYSLLQNNLYRVVAILNADDSIWLSVEVCGWDSVDVAYSMPSELLDFYFGGWGDSWGGDNAKTMHTNAGGLEYALFEFELYSQVGDRWVASLTNGVDFSLVEVEVENGLYSSSSGYAAQSAVIAVMANKTWRGDVRETEFYITVAGEELDINSSLRYEGSEKRIKIKQVASYE